MRASLTFGRIASIPIGIHYSWIVIATLITFTLVSHFGLTQPEWNAGLVWTSAFITAVLFFLSLLVHELSHALVAKRIGLSVRSITLFALGGVAQIDDEAGSAGDEFWMAVVGPLTSFAIGLLCLLGASQLGWSFATFGGGADGASPPGAILGWLGYINVVLAMFNLLPAYPLDGGRVLRAIVWRATGDARRSTRNVARVGQGVAFLLIMLGVLRFFAGAGLTGLWLAFIGWFLLEAAAASYVQATLGEDLQRIRVGELMADDCAIVDDRGSLQDFVDNVLLRSGRRCFLVRRGDAVVGLITAADVQQVKRDAWPSTPVSSAARPLASLHTVSPETPASEALRIMSQRDVHQLPVVRSGHVDGVITRGHLLQLIETRTRLERAHASGQAG